MTHSPFGKTQQGEAVELYTLGNGRGLSAKVATYGGIITELHVPDRSGRSADVVLGFDTLPPYFTQSPYFGAIVGRVANRIGGGEFTLNGKLHTLHKNDGPNTLHGGLRAFDKVVWHATPTGENALILTYNSPDNDEGFPGNLATTVVYTLTANNALQIDYTATTDQPTPVNLTQHSYFNLRGQGNGDVLNHEVFIAADRYTPVDDKLIPTGEIAPVAGTPLDFNKPTPVGARIAAVAPGYDHNYVLNNAGPSLSIAARVYEPESGRVMEVLTTQPGIQLYTGNYLKDVHGKAGAVYDKHSALCLETQHFPDSVNRPNFPSILLQPGQTYKQTTVYRFSTR